MCVCVYLCIHIGIFDNGLKKYMINQHFIVDYKLVKKD